MRSLGVNTRGTGAKGVILVMGVVTSKVDLSRIIDPVADINDPKTLCSENHGPSNGKPTGLNI